jgi:hypothetical protein
MESHVEIKQATSVPGSQDIIITLTDIQMHTNARPTESIGNILQRSIEKNQSGRIYFQPMQTKNEATSEDTMRLDDPVLTNFISECNRQGKRVFLNVPDDIPIGIGKDTRQFVESIKGKRIIRKLDKPTD